MNNKKKVPASETQDTTHLEPSYYYYLSLPLWHLTSLQPPFPATPNISIR